MLAPVVWAVVVTYNRRALLEQCLDALRAQTRPPDRILVVDNASTDGTAEWVRGQDDVVALLLDENVGGAGGFHAGMRLAHAGGADWLWLMDDDTIPRPDALERLLEPAIPRRSCGRAWRCGRTAACTR
jgi:GT2 family glycosyltransferase